MKKTIILSVVLTFVTASVEQATQNLDGTISEVELKQYNKLGSTGNNIIYLNTEPNYIRIGIKSEKLNVASVCIANQDQVLILHASAALGRLDYKLKVNNTWETDEEFAWGMRETDMDTETIRKREAHLRKYSWVANTMPMGEAGHTEFIISRKILGGDEMFLAAGLMPESNPQEIIALPKKTAGECAALSLVSGAAKTSYSFNPEAWYPISKFH